MEQKSKIKDKGEGLTLPLVEQFYTVQGEGFHSGKAAYFIRIGGCDIGCRWCDSKISWSPGIHKMVSIEEIVQNVLDTPAKAVVVTGGEPTLYNLEPLSVKLQKNNIETFIETSGAYELTGTWDWICLSPKPNVQPHPSNYLKANELKVIIYDTEDIEWAEKCAQNINNKCLKFLQPEWSRYSVNIGDIVEYVKNNPEWRISLQSHKFMKIP